MAEVSNNNDPEDFTPVVIPDDPMRSAIKADLDICMSTNDQLRMEISRLNTVIAEKGVRILRLEETVIRLKKMLTVANKKENKP